MTNETETNLKMRAMKMMRSHNHIVPGQTCLNHEMYSMTDVNGGTKFVARESTGGKTMISLASTKLKTTYLTTLTTNLNLTPHKLNKMQLTLQTVITQLDPTNAKPP